MTVQQLRPADLRELDELREQATVVLRRNTRRGGKRYATVIHPTALARMRRGDVSNPVYGIDRLLFGMQRAGEPYSAAQEIVAHIQGVADELWQRTLPSLDMAQVLEAEADAEEDTVQVLAIMDPHRLPDHIAALERQVAAGRTLLASIRSWLTTERRTA